MQVDTGKIQALTRELLLAIGEDPDREGLKGTPRRVAEALAFLTSGYRADPAKVINNAIFTQEANSMVIVKNIELYSLCEHHMLPFFGRCHIGYLPRGRVFGLSKLARLVDVYARRLQTQEHLTSQVATAIDEILKPRGVAVMIEAEHMCMSLRGVEKPGALTVTTHFTGAFRDDAGEQVRFMTMLRGAQR